MRPFVHDPNTPHYLREKGGAKVAAIVQKRTKLLLRCWETLAPDVLCIGGLRGNPESGSPQKRRGGPGGGKQDDSQHF